MGEEAPKATEGVLAEVAPTVSMTSHQLLRAIPSESLTPVGSLPAGPQKEGAFMGRPGANLGPAQKFPAGLLPLRKGAYCGVNCTLFVQSP